MKYAHFADHVTSCGMPEELLTLVDLSGSMEEDDWKPSRKAGAIDANKELIRVKARYYPQDRIGIIGFGSGAKLLHDPVCLTDGGSTLLNALQNLHSMGSTNFTTALELAEACLFGHSIHNPKTGIGKGFERLFSELFCVPLQRSSSHIRENCTASKETAKRIVMLTDGGHNTVSSPLSIASRLKNAGVAIDCIGIGGCPEDVDEELLRKIASRNSDGSIRYCFIGNQQKLVQKYESLAHHIRPV